MRNPLSNMRPHGYAQSLESAESAESALMSTDTRRNTLWRLLMALGSILCMILASILGVRSEWYKDKLSHKIHQVCTVIGILYLCMVLVVFVVVFVLAYVSKRPQTSTVNWKVKFVIHIIVIAMLFLSADVFEKAPPDLYLPFGLFLAASHIYLAAEFLHIHENYGLTEGVMLAALIVAFHLSKIWPLKLFVLACGGAIIVSYLRRTIFFQGTLPQEPSIVEGNTSNINTFAVERRSSSGNQSQVPCTMQRSSGQCITIRRPITVDRSLSLDNEATYEFTIMKPMEPLPPLLADRIEATITAESKGKGKAVDEAESSGSASVANKFVPTVIETGASDGGEEAWADNEKIWDQNEETWRLIDHEAESSGSVSNSKVTYTSQYTPCRAAVRRSLLSTKSFEEKILVFIRRQCFENWTAPL